jgi:multiple sugar transport system ATP-binding protein
VFETPANLFVAGFIGTPQMNFFEGILARRGTDWRFENGNLSVPVPSARYGVELVEGRRVWAGLRAEDLVPVGHGVRPKNAVTISGAVNLAEMLGSETLLFGVLGTESFVSRMQQPRLIGGEETMSFDVNVDRLHLFDRESEKNLVAAGSG